jgi:hypothetical protein
VFERLKYLQFTAPPPSKELIEIMRRVSNRLEELGATVTILHDEYLIEAPAGKENEAMEALKELTNWQLTQIMKGYSDIKRVTE